MCGILKAMSLLKPAEKQGSHFQNPIPTELGGLGLMFKVLPMYLSNREETEPTSPVGPFRTDPRLFEVAPVSGLRVTWFGHSASLIEIDGVRILVDPVWEQ